MFRTSVIAACSTLLLVTSVAQPARADYRQNATGVCQAALPAYDGLIRKRPVAIRNEGNVDAFVSCSMGAENGVVHPYAEAILTNGTAQALTVNCTFVTGRVNTPLRYYPVSLVIPAGDAQYFLQNFDNAIDTANLVNVSCVLPPNVEINYLHVG